MRSITFNGQTLFRPGAISRIRTRSSGSLGPTATGIVAILGEADGGEPDTVIEIADPALAKEIFTSGPLADAIRLAFTPTQATVSSGAFKVLAFKTNASTQASTTLPSSATVLTGTSTAASTTTAVVLTAGGMVATGSGEHAGRWLLAGGERRRIVSNTVDTFTVSPGFSTAPLNLDALAVLENQLTVTSRDYGLATNQIGIEFEAGATTNKWVVTVSKGTSIEQSGEILGEPAMTLRYEGGPVVAASSGPITVATTGVITVDVGAAPLINAYAGMVLDLPGDLRRLILSNTAADPCAITLAVGHELTAAQAADSVGGTASVRNITTVVANITGASGVATGLTSTATVVPASAADNLALTFLPSETLTAFVERINTTTNYRAAVGPTFNGATTLMKTLDFGVNSTAVDVRFDFGVTPTTKGHFRRDLQGLVDHLNTYSELVEATRTTGAAGEGDELPTGTGGVWGTTQDTVVYLSGGTRGISTNTTFQDGFDALLLERINHIVPLISEDLTNEGNGSTATFASVAAQLAAFIAEANSSAKNECGGYIGMEGTRTQLNTQANVFNEKHIQLFGQKITGIDVDGSVYQFPEWGQAVQAAGSRAGLAEIGEPLTYKSIMVSGLTQDSSWTPKSTTDVNSLLGNGVMFAEKVENGGYRWVRDITTHISDDEEFNIAGSTVDAVRFVAYDFRKKLEDRFTGPKGTLSTIASVREFAAAQLGQYLRDNILVESLDPETLTVLLPGYRNLRVFLNGAVLTVRAEIFPVQGITFEIVDLTLLNTNLVA